MSQEVWSTTYALLAIVALIVAIKIMFSVCLYVYDPHDLRSEQKKLRRLVQSFNAGKITKRQVESQDPNKYVKFGLAGSDRQGVAELTTVAYISRQLLIDRVSF